MKDTSNLNNFSPITKPETHSFTTSRKNRNNSPVRRRCLEFIDAVHHLGYSKTIPLDDAKELFMATLGIMNRASIKAYFGVQPHRSIQNIQRFARYQSGVTSMKNIQLSQNVTYQVGYFELLRLATFERKGTTWFMVLNEVGVVPQLVSESLMKDCVNKSNVEIYLSPNRQGEQPLKVENDRVETGEKREREYRCREINSLDFENPETAKPENVGVGIPTPKKCVLCGKVDESNPYRIWCPKGGGERSKNDVCIVEAV